MGTSQSNPGAGGSNPLIPPWADDDGQGPGPAPEPPRFKGFRTALGEFARSGSRESLSRSLQRHVERGYGGSTTATRRHSSTIAAGAALAAGLGGFAAGETGTEVAAALQAVVGGSAEEVADALCQVLVQPGTQDADSVRISLANAVLACEETFEDFSPGNLTLDSMVDFLQAFVVEQIVERVLLDAGDAMQSATSAVQREQELRDFLVQLVDFHSDLLAEAVHDGVRDAQVLGELIHDTIFGVMSDLEDGEA